MNSEKMNYIQEKDTKNKEKINKLKLKIKELTTLNEDILNKSLFINKNQNIDSQLNNLSKENSNLSKIIKKKINKT